MSANVETMMYVREKPWHGLGTMVQEAPTSLDALRLAGLDWDVEPKKVGLLGSDQPIENAVANVRSSDGKVLGIVTERYKAVQNVDAFAFTDTLIGGDVRYETAGSLNGGRRIWLLAKMPSVQVAGDEVEPYLCFTNTHDGTGAVRVCMTPIRVVCNNTLNLALSRAQRAWSVFHTGDLNRKIMEARQCLGLAQEYMAGLQEYAEEMTSIRVDADVLQRILDVMFPVAETNGRRANDNAKRLQEQFRACYAAPDIQQFAGTGWGVLNAMTDMVAHAAPLRMTKNYREANWGRIMNGHALVDRMAQLVQSV